MLWGWTKTETEESTKMVDEFEGLGGWLVWVSLRLREGALGAVEWWWMMHGIVSSWETRGFVQGIGCKLCLVEDSIEDLRRLEVEWVKLSWLVWCRAIWFLIKRSRLGQSSSCSTIKPLLARPTFTLSSRFSRQNIIHRPPTRLSLHNLRFGAILTFYASIKARKNISTFTQLSSALCHSEFFFLLSFPTVFHQSTEIRGTRSSHSPFGPSHHGQRGVNINIDFGPEEDNCFQFVNGHQHVFY